MDMFLSKQWFFRLCRKSSAFGIWWYLICNIFLKYHFFHSSVWYKMFYPFLWWRERICWCVICCHLISKARKPTIQKHLREEGLGKWALSPLLHKGPLGGSKNSGFFSQKMPPCVPSGSQFQGASGASASPSIAQNLIPEVILESTLHLLSPEHMESPWGYTP